MLMTVDLNLLYFIVILKGARSALSIFFSLIFVSKALEAFGHDYNCFWRYVLHPNIVNKSVIGISE